MITFYDEKGNGYGAQVELKTKNAVNGERSISGTIVSNKQVLSKLDRGWSFTFDSELYKIIYAKPKDEGKNISLSFDAVHQFFYDFEHSNCYKEFNGSNRFEVYIEAIFKDSGYRYVIEVEAKAIRKENFGNASRLKMFKEIIKEAGLEFSVTGKVVRILKKVGTDLSTVVRKNFNMNELTIEKNIGGFITYKKGFGAWKDEKNHDMGRYTSEYESPLARIYGRIEGEPVTDERYKETGKLLERLKKEVDESYSISVQLDMEDLTQAGYKYTRPRAGDYIMAINETIGFREKIRIVSYESSYDVTGRLLSHKVTCNDIGTVQKAITSEGSIMRSVSESKQYAEGALDVATQALISANGKNTNYYRATKPKDEPRGTLHEGDLLYLTVGEETELYYWSGTEWLPKILKVDTRKIETLLSEAQTATNKAIEQANVKAEEALKKAGTLPDTSKLSDQIKQQILSSPDLQNKVTEGVKSVDGDTIYSKIVSKVTQQFATVGQFDALDRVQNDQGRDLLNLSKQITAQTLEYNKITESNKMYERILGKSESEAPDKLSRLVMSSDIFQTEVGKYVTSDNNLIVNSETMDQHVLVNENRPGVNVSVSDGVFTIKAQGVTSYNWSGFTLPIYVRKIYRGETYSVGFKYRVRGALDSDFNVIIKNHILNRAAFVATAARASTPVSDEWKEFQGTFYMSSDFEFGNHRNLPFYVYVTKNGWVEIKEIMLVRGSRTGPYKPSQFDDAFAETKALGSKMTSKIGEVSGKTDEAKQIALTAQARAGSAQAKADSAQAIAEGAESRANTAVTGAANARMKADSAQAKAESAQTKAENAQARAAQVAEQARQAQQMAEAIRTQVTQLAGTYSIKNINSAGDILGQLNLNKDGSIKLNEALIAIGEKTYVKDGVIKKAMIGDGQIGTAHIGEIDANIARLINVSSKNIVSDGLTANIIHGGVLASKNGKLKFDLDNSALESTSDESVIKRIGSGANFPTQFLKFSKGWVQGRSQPVGMTILGSNRYGDGRSEDGNSGGFTGIRIWNGSNAEGYADSVDVVGDEIVLCDSPFQNRNGWLMKTTYSDTSLFSITNKRNSRIYAGDFLFEKAGGGNASLRQILWQIGDNIAQLYRFRAQNNEGTPGWNDTNKWGWS